jgi:outer membrane lipoprotein-sorting protein
MAKIKMKIEKIKNLFVKSSVKVDSDFDNRILNDTLTAFEKSKTKSAQFQPSVWRIIMKSKIIKLAVTSIVMVIVGTLAYKHMGSFDATSTAWASVVDKIQAAKCVSYKYVVEDANGNVKMETRVMYMPPNSLRRETLSENGKTIITICRANEMLWLYPETKTGMIKKYSGDKSNDLAAKIKNTACTHLWQNFKQYYDKGTFVGSEKLDGYQADIFVFEDSGGNLKAKIWANIQTSLPIRAELDFKTTTPLRREPVRYILTDFSWNNLDESLFDMQAPPEYKINNFIAIPIPSEQTLVDALGASAELADGNFPMQFEDKPMAKFLADVMHANDNAEHDKRMAIYQKVLKIDAGIKFTKTLIEQKREWHYCGNGIKLGDKKAPVCWWSTGPGLYHIVYGDLSILEVPEKELPK